MYLHKLWISLSSRPKEGEEEHGEGVGTSQRSPGTFLQEAENLDDSILGTQESQTRRSPRLRALRLQEDTDCEIVTGKSKRGKKSRQHKQNSMYFFSLQLVFPLPGISALGWDQRDLGARDQQLSSQAAGGSWPQHTDPFLLPWREWKTAVSGALLFGLFTPSYQRKALCSSLSPIPWQANNTKRNNPSIWTPSFHSWAVRQFGRSSPDPKARIWLKQEGAAWRGILICSPRLICFFASLYNR